ncbi:MAG: isoprenylcysteine carboxylmethyltransferase family protein [Anaerolineales bacterium]|nr:isoprenylcysteine carboxylmethyltransferase family protein [Anaerolineales bacterium]
MNDNTFRIFATIIFVTTIFISGYFRSKADKVTGEKVSWKDEGIVMILLLRVGGLLLWFSIIGFLIYPPLLAWSKVGLPEWARWIGIGIGFVCALLIYWIFNSIGSGISPTVGTRKEHKLVTHGIYRWVRHPLYSVGTLLFLSFATMADSWFIAAMAILAFVLLAIRLPNEEAHLIDKFGNEYREYMKTTGQFLPKFQEQK